jgi:MFS family permease
MAEAGGGRKGLILAAMIFAVSMTFIDQTIVAIAVPSIQDDLSLSATGVQWIINGYLLSLSALFAFGGRLADIAGHRRMVTIGVVLFATASALCGATPSGSLDEAWLIVFRIIQGAGAALMFPAALAIVLGAFPMRERGRAMAIFFAVAGGLTSIGPIAGGYLTEWTWRAIFWVNIPVAIIALVLTAISKPADEKHPAPLDYRGTVLVSGGMGLAYSRRASGAGAAPSPGSASPSGPPCWPHSSPTSCGSPTRCCGSGSSRTAPSRSTTRSSSC